jgi:hypothetical protein
MNRKLGFASALLAGSVIFVNSAVASDTLLGAVVGGGAGVVIGQAVGGRDGAIVGGALGAVTGAAIASNHRYERNVVYADRPVVYEAAPRPVYRHVEPVVVEERPVYRYVEPVAVAPGPVYRVAHEDRWNERCDRRDDHRWDRGWNRRDERRWSRDWDRGWDRHDGGRD